VKNKDWNSTSNAVYVLNYHFVWSTKYRKKVLIPPVAAALLEIIQQICLQYNFDILQSEIMPDHVHLFLSAKPSLSPSKMMMEIRGSSAYQLFMRHPELRQQLWNGHLWNPSYYVGSAGNVSAETIKKYIENQRTH